ncbi:MAG: amidohydrolase [Planctomycetota bacterium]
MPPRSTRPGARPGPRRARRRRTACLALVLAGTLGLGAARARPPLDGPASKDGAQEERLVLFHNGTFHRGFDPQDSSAYAPAPAEAVLASDGRIVAVGSYVEVAASAEGRAVENVDLGGAQAFPGFNDAHVRVERLGEALEQIDLTEAGSYEDVVRILRERAAEQPAGTWVVARGWNRAAWADRAWPEHGPLSAAVPLHPVLAYEAGGFAALVNGAALTLLGLDGDALPEDGDGGAVLRREGRATGVLFGTAMRAAEEKLDAPSDEVRVRRLLRGQGELLARGITAVHDMGVDPRGVALLRGLRDDGRLRLRVAAYLDGDAIGSPDRARELADVGGDGLRLRVVGVALTIDGALGARGAALLDEYSDAPGRRGPAEIDVGRLGATLDAAARAGLQPATTAVGDRGVGVALDLYGRSAQTVEGFAGLRPRIERAELVVETDVRRFAELGVLPSFQPARLVDSLGWIEARIGRERGPRAHPWRRLADGSPLPIVFGSAAPRGRARPLEWVHAALTRPDAAGAPKNGYHPEQRFSAASALAAMTSGPVFAVADEERRGLLAPGYRCDLTVCDVDLTRLTASNARRALDAKILMTVVDGEIVHRQR